MTVGRQPSMLSQKPVGRGRWSSRLLLACVIAAALAMPGAVRAVDDPSIVYVDRANSNCTTAPSGGSSAQPFCTISGGANKATAGMTVLVSEGTYVEQVAPKSGVSGSPVTFRAEPGETVTVTGRNNGFYVSSKSWITIEGFNVTRTIEDGLYVSKSSHIELINNHVSFAGQPSSGSVAKGIRLSNTTDSLVSGNTVDHNTDYGIYVLLGATRNEIVDNEVSFNARQFTRAASGIRLHNSSGNTIAANVSHHNEDSGIEVVTGSDNNLVANNVSHDNGDHGIDILDAVGQRVISNSIYRNITAGINVEGGSTGTIVANNISVDNAINGPRTRGNLRVDSTSTTGTTVNYDLLHLSSPDILVVWGSTNYTSLASFRSATGQESNGIQGDPRWVSPTSGDFHLREEGSPAIDSANSGANGQPETDAEGRPRTDDPRTANTGAGPRAYDDRGAYEVQPFDAPPSAALSVTPPSGLVDLSVSADASASADPDTTSPIASYRFDFGDGSPVVGPQAGATSDHTYTAAGNYTVTVTVTDTAGLSATATDTVTVTDDRPAAALSVTPPSGLVDLTVNADASASSDVDGTPIASYRFDFGDGSQVVGPQAGATANHTYTAAGNYTVTVTVTDTAGLSATATDTVTVTDDPPIASVAVTPSSGVAPVLVTADASASSDDDGTPIASYAFDFGDGSPVVGPQAGATASHTYTTGGSFTVTVTVRDTAGLSSQVQASVVLRANLVSNPGFETDTAGWNTSGSGSGVTLTRVTGGHSGGWAAKLANTGTTATTCALNDSPNWVLTTAAGTYTASLWAKADKAGASLKLRIREYSGSTLVGTATTTVPLTTAWQEVTTAYTPAAPGSSTLDYNAYVAAAEAPPGTCFYADDVWLYRN
jgi:parallel beta-helix repeat protein